MLAGFSGACFAENDSVTSPPAVRASPVGVELKSRIFWVFVCRMSFLRCMSYSPLLSFGPSILVPGSAYLLLHLSVFGVPQYPCRRQDLLCPMLTSALRSECRDTGQLSWGKLNRLPCTIAGSTLCIFDGCGLRSTLPACPTLTPPIRFLSIDSHVCSTLPSDLVCRRVTSLQR